MIEDYPTFSDFWKLTNKIGRKELMAKRWQVLPQWKKIEVFNKALSDKDKKAAEFYLNIGRWKK
jgi:hypothetical protein|tara:strand:- start:571 stop:762 length:192 start_codon:yes stop_codon:yes gene_type:complete